MRIGVGRFTQETNSFSPAPTDLDAFRRQGLAAGEAFDLRERLAYGAIWPFAEIADARGDVELVPLVKAWTGPGGPLTRAAFEAVMALFARRLDEAGPLDAVFLSLHGAMAAEHHDDPEGLLMEMIRGRVGADAWIVAAMDHHACMTRRKVAAADLTLGQRTQPHDQPDTGRQTAELFFRVLDGGLRPAVALRRIPMITHQEQFLTARPPMKTWFDLARAIEARPGVLSVSTYPMQPWLDVEEGGWTAVVYTDGDPSLAGRLADELAACAWELRHDFMRQDSVPVAEAVARAEAAPRGIVLLSDTGDSAAGGATGDSNVILAEMLRQGVRRRALVPVVDGPAARAAAAAGVGATVDLRLGRTLDPAWGAPLGVTAKVLHLTDRPVDTGGHYEPYSQGVAALVEIGAVLVGVTEFRGRQMMMPAFWTHLGIDPTDRDRVQAVVVKTASNFQYFGPWTAEVIRVDTPGHTQSRVAAFDWRRLPRPIFPLDHDALPSAT
ncbi:MAG: M81 family metallopeptidase [Rhodobacteraceae bacterium]|nr:M81 family metallopeptidase [Paracoccaceae bacterium]